MNSAFDVKEAVNFLNDYVVHHKTESGTYLQELSKDNNWQHNFRIVYSDCPVSWRLMPAEQDSEDAEEVVFTRQGFIVEKNLPPIIHSSSQLETQPAFLTQHITLTGLNTPAFEQAITAILDLYPVIYRQFPDGQFETLNIGRCPVTDGRTLMFSNRYFTRRKDAPTIAAIDFPSDVDPLGLLKARTSAALIHTQENSVEYYIRLSETDGNAKFQKIAPQTFRAGDLVEIQFSMVIYQKRTTQFICKPIFYSVASINQEFANRMVLKQITGTSKTSTSNSPISRPKRKVGYEVLASAPAKRGRIEGREMEVDQHQGNAGHRRSTSDDSGTLNDLENMSIGR